MTRPQPLKVIGGFSSGTRWFADRSARGPAPLRRRARVIRYAIRGISSSHEHVPLPGRCILVGRHVRRLT